jgi:transcriptional regulator with XRE-family HTH domain
MEWEILANTLKECREEANLSARELSIKLNRDPAYIFKVETGIQFPDFVAVLDIANAIGVDPLEIVSRVIRKAKSES